MPNIKRDSKPYRRRTALMRRTLPPICWICLGEIDLNLPPSHRMAWTADHIEPRALGGKLLSELRPAHRACNTARGIGRAVTTTQNQTPTSKHW